MAFVRQSKFRHVYGKSLKKDQCFDNIRVTKSSTDRPLCAVNPKYLATITEAAGGSSFLVIPLTKVGRIERDFPVVSGHKAPVLDVAWCPHDDNVIASCSEDCMIKVWLIPEGGVVTENLTESICTLRKHQKKVVLIQWHPTARNILASAGADNLILIWNAGTEELFVEMAMPDLTLSLSFNLDGSKLVTTCKDKMLRIIDPRSGATLQEGKCHGGSKPSQAVYLNDGKVFTTGFSRMSERQYALWDENNLDKALTIEEIDNSNGVLLPIYDSSTNMVYLCGKGDSVIRYFEVTDEEPYVHYLSMFQATNPQRGICCMPKRGVDVNVCEIARFYKLHNTGFCEVIPMIVPRKSDLFQDDLYPDAPGSEPSVSAEDWFDKTVDKPPVLVSMRTGFVGNTQQSTAKVAARKSAVVDKLAKTPVVNKLGAAKASTETKISTQTICEDKLASAMPQKQPEPTKHVETPKPKQQVKEERPPPVSEPCTSLKSCHADVSQENSAVPPSEDMETKMDVEGTDIVDSVASVTPGPPGFDAQALVEDIRKLKLIVKAHERRIKTLEERVSQYEGNTSEEENGENC